MANNEVARQVYDDSQIQVLEGLEAVRRHETSQALDHRGGLFRADGTFTHDEDIFAHLVGKRVEHLKIGACGGDVLCPDFPFRSSSK